MRNEQWLGCRRPAGQRRAVVECHPHARPGGDILFLIEDREAAEEALVLGDEILIGKTTLEAVDLCIVAPESR